MEIEIPAKINENRGATMGNNEYREFACDLCGSDDAVEVPHIREYTNGQAAHICKKCGFVYVKKRRSAKKVADVWSKEIFGGTYTAKNPHVKGRQTYVAEFIDRYVGLKDKKVCEIGAGEGQFLDIIRKDEYGATAFGIEPSKNNCDMMRKNDIDCFNGTIEEYSEQMGKDRREADIVTILWTLENTQDCRKMLDVAHQILKDGGHIVVATGSRILVPFKKPLHDYFSSNPADTHSFRFSANTLRGILAVSGFEVVHVNPYIENDFLCVIAEKRDKKEKIEWQGDDYKEVHDFFDRWHRETQRYQGMLWKEEEGRYIMSRANAP
jgi:2-polyprenyl-3-methyl-5-hydroxy-6-metoxy-1,4-benzoquinol methylase